LAAGRSFDKERVVDLVLLLLGLLLDSLRETLGQGCCEVNFLHVVAVVVLAKDEEAVRFVRETANETHSAYGVLVEVWLTQQVEEAVSMNIDDLEVSVDHSQVEPTLVWEFGLSFWNRCLTFGHDDLDLGHREACLFKCRAVLAEEDLLLVWVIALAREEGERHDRKVLLSGWDMLLFLVLGS